MFITPGQFTEFIIGTHCKFIRMIVVYYIIAGELSSLSTEFAVNIGGEFMFKRVFTIRKVFMLGMSHNC